MVTTANLYPYTPAGESDYATTEAADEDVMRAIADGVSTSVLPPTSPRHVTAAASQWYRSHAAASPAAEPRTPDHAAIPLDSALLGSLSTAKVRRCRMTSG